MAKLIRNDRVASITNTADKMENKVEREEEEEEEEEEGVSY